MIEVARGLSQVLTVGSLSAPPLVADRGSARLEALSPDQPLQFLQLIGPQALVDSWAEPVAQWRHDVAVPVQTGPLTELKGAEHQTIVGNNLQYIGSKSIP